MYNFAMAALPWIAIGIGVAFACAYQDKINAYWKKWREVWNSSDK